LLKSQEEEEKGDEVDMERLQVSAMESHSIVTSKPRDGGQRAYSCSLCHIDFQDLDHQREHFRRERALK